MFNFYATLLKALPNNQPIEGVAEKLAYGGKMMLVGMGVVFSVLILLCLALLAFNIVFGNISQKSALTAKKEAVQKVDAAPAPTVTVASNEQEEIIAVIAAAIAAASAENPGAKFKVVSFKRK